jgi:uracil-DNA glycosylase
VRPALEAAQLARVVAEARACRICAHALPLGANPVLRAAAGASLLIVGQAPGARVHASGLPWKDASGDRLRDWLGLSRELFYDESRIAILPIGFCYPGRNAAGADLPPRPECAPAWHGRIRPLMRRVRLTLLVGSYAQRFYLGAARAGSVAQTVRQFDRFLPDFVPLPHPSWHTRSWATRHAWFESRVLPEVRALVRAALE